ncbi:uncharacterized protein C8R40DRAFT_343778 [Lentinula edodes]|uniref:uncharacterized protein n=1 Tax=Lentinula edodes TaxID=5353 RepID=UPI001E8D645C|nr:uncharacterized protein C8R40DRAFT_343778 [Lentinula edodes]KAH7874020.1 hypothetical protein C8R40DRAFT_343778 [Lentinula edodes]
MMSNHSASDLVSDAARITVAETAGEYRKNLTFDNTRITLFCAALILSGIVYFRCTLYVLKPSNFHAHDMSTNVLIVGGWPRCLALALLLRSGPSVRIVEEQVQFHSGERGAGIQEHAHLSSYFGL